MDKQYVIYNTANEMILGKDRTDRTDRRYPPIWMDGFDHISTRNIEVYVGNIFDGDTDTFNINYALRFEFNVHLCNTLNRCIWVRLYDNDSLDFADTLEAEYCSSDL